MIARRLQQYIEAYARVTHGSNDKPDWGLATYCWERSPTDVVSSSLRVRAQQRVKEEVLLDRLRKGSGRGKGGQDDSLLQAIDDGVLPAPANSPAPNKTKKG